MERDLFSERCPQILGIPPEALAYQRWLDGQRPRREARDYLFSETVPRFEPRKEDIVVALPGLTVQRTRGTTRLTCREPTVDLPLPDISARVAERILGALDGERRLLEVRWEAKAEPGALERFLRATFGIVLFAPDAVAPLERAVSGVEISRFPCAPYGIERPYWNNMVDVREHFERAREPFRTPEQFEHLLREMHLLALMGRNLSSYYKPASPVSDRVVAPGALFLDAPHLVSTPRGTLFLDGPRVNVSLLGGRAYHEVLYTSVDDPDALADLRVFEVDGVPWGRVVLARGEHDDGFRSWFCPPRPMVQAHWERLVTTLRDAWEGAAAADSVRSLRALAHFHQAFIRLHPFHCANQSIAMNLVNAILHRLLGVGIPHLLLDHFALRTSEQGYARIFARAVRAFAVVDDDPARRLSELLERKSRSFSIVEELGRSRDPSETRAILERDMPAARWALVRD